MYDKIYKNVIDFKGVVLIDRSYDNLREKLFSNDLVINLYYEKMYRSGY